MAEIVILSPPGLYELAAEAVLRTARALDISPQKAAALVQKLTGLRFELHGC